LVVAFVEAFSFFFIQVGFPFWEFLEFSLFAFVVVPLPPRSSFLFFFLFALVSGHFFFSVLTPPLPPSIPLISWMTDDRLRKVSFLVVVLLRP